jgi:DNA-binding NtrC family response regulator
MNPRILLVEDDLLVGPVVKEMLNNGGYDVVLANDLADTVILKDFAFDAVITDFKLKNSDGCDVIDFLRSRRPAIPALLISGYGSRVANCCAHRGIYDVTFLAKPFAATELLATLASLIAKPASAPPFQTSRDQTAK